MHKKIAVTTLPHHVLSSGQFRILALCFMMIFTLFMILSGGMAKAEERVGANYKAKQALSVVELFTSQGCSSCPPADAVLETYAKRSDVVALSYSVDYWDYLGWRDTFGRAENSERQRNYARARGDGAVYTPQVVVNGLTHMNGASASKIDTNINQLRVKLAHYKTEMSVNEADGKMIVSANCEGQDYQGDVILWMVRVQDVGKVAIRRGENQGRSLNYHNIVLGVDRIGTMHDKSIEISIDRNDVLPQAGKHSVFLLQVGATGPVLGALEVH